MFKQVRIYYELYWKDYKCIPPNQSQLKEIIFIMSKQIGIENNSEWLKFIDVYFFKVCFFCLFVY